MADDPSTANLILTNKVFQLTGLFFDLKQLWVPAPKQRLGQIKDLNQGFYSLLVQFYQELGDLSQRLMLAEQMLPVIFNN